MLSLVLVPLLVGVGLYILIRIRCFYIFHPLRSFGRAAAALGRRENLAAFTLALAGTLGVGNLLGVAVGIMVGGAGSLFWLFISAIPASAVKYAEVLVSSEEDGRGIPDAARRSFGRLGAPLSLLYFAACLLLSLFMGAALQTKSAVDSASVTMDTTPYISALIMCALVLASVLISGRKTGKITMLVIPVTTIIYIIVAVSTVFANFDRLPSVISLVMREAFEPRAGAGGALACLSSRALREGFSRGMLSNEAGAGTSSLGHTTGAELPPAVRGIFGVLEVVFDTSVLCTLSGLVILLGVPDPGVYSGGMQLLLSAVEGSVGAFPASLVTFSVWAFAYSTIVCWYYYGSECLLGLTGHRCTVLFLFVFIFAVLSGAFISERYLIALSDILLLILTGITLPTLIKNSDRIVLLSESCGLLGLKESDAGEGLDAE